MPVASAAAATPPQPRDRASTAAQIRRPRSPKEPETSTYFLRIHSTTGLSGVPAASHNHPIQAISFPTTYFRAVPKFHGSASLPWCLFGLYGSNRMPDLGKEADFNPATSSMSTS